MGYGVLKRNSDRVIRIRIIDHDVDKFSGIIGLSLGSRILHDTEEMVMNPRLVDDNVGHLRQILRHVIDFAVAGDT